MHKSFIWVPTALALGISLVIAGCGGNNDDNGGGGGGSTAKSVSFKSLSFPSTDVEKRQVRAAASIKVDGKDRNIGYRTILRSGDAVGELPATFPPDGTALFAQLFDQHGDPILGEDGEVVYSNSNDYSSFHSVGGKLFMVSQFEDRPGAMNLVELAQDEDTGALSALKLRNIDLSGIHGGWVHCAGSVTPWDSHLGSEEYEPDVRLVDPVTGTKVTPYGDEDDYYHAMDRYFGGDRMQMNPYFWGYPIEVSVLDADGKTEVVKHYAMGRVAIELAYVMPDSKTVYITDDGTGTGLFKFVADTAGDLSAGTLYAVKLTQISDDMGGVFDVTWVDLGHATDSQVSSLVDSSITFADIFDTAAPVVDGDGKDTGACPTGFTSIAKGHDATEGGTYHECLSLNSGMALAASRLETRRYAAMMGATTELSKEEGVTYNPDDDKLYIAMSDIRYSMEDNKRKGSEDTRYDLGGPNHVRVAWNPCGGIYELDLDTDYSATAMRGILLGDPDSGTDADNECNIDGIANPDNVTYMPGYGTLIIGEDTGGGHQNDAIWAYNLANDEMTRIETTPYGSETTSPYFYPNLNGWAYLTSVVQHPYGESDGDMLIPGSGESRAYTGYIGAMPPMD